MINKDLLTESKQYRLLLFLLILSSFIGALFVIGQAFHIARIIDAVFISDFNFSEVKRELFILLFLMTCRAVFVWFSEFISGYLGIKIQANLRQRLVKSLFCLGPFYLNKEESGELITTVMQGTENIVPYFSKFLPQIFIAVLVPIAVLVSVFSIDLKVVGILVITVPLIPIFMILIGRLAEKKNSEQWEKLTKLGSHFLDVLEGLKTLKIFGRSVEQAQVVYRMSKEFSDSTLAVLKIAFLSSLMLELVATISTAIIAVFVGFRLLYGQMEFFDAFFILLLLPEFFLPLRQLGAHFHTSMTSLSAAERIYKILQAADDCVLNENRGHFVQTDKIEISFNNIFYSYDDDSVVLKNFSMKIKPGEEVALVGRSGAGKSTIAALLVGIISPQQGDVLINGRSLNEIDLSDWLEQIAVVPQSPHLFSGTVAQNIAMTDDFDVKSVIEAASDAYIDEFIQSLPLGYDTVLGEQGQELSGGQKRRIAIARAFYRKANVIILDEVTASLDVYSENAISQALKKLKKGKTVLVIAHRLSTIYDANKIIVLDEGCAIEEGTHNELINKNGHYHQLLTAFRGVK